MLAEDLRLVPTTHIRWFAATSCRGQEVLVHTDNPGEARK